MTDSPIILALAIGAVVLLAIVALGIIALLRSGHWHAAREAERRAAKPRRRMRAVIDYSATMNRTPAPEGLSPERLKARSELLEASDRIARAKAARKSTKRFVASAVRARAAILAQDLKLKRAE